MTMNRLAILLLFALMLAGCRQSAQNATAEIEIDLRTDMLAIGETMLVITLTDATGQPVSAQKVEVRGDMTHAGMQPVLAESSEGENGEYEMPFEWTMSGDWIVTVKATMPDGTVAEERFDLTVSTGG
jgi:hypothetical protein